MSSIEITDQIEQLGADDEIGFLAAAVIAEALYDGADPIITRWHAEQVDEAAQDVAALTGLDVEFILDFARAPQTAQAALAA